MVRNIQAVGGKKIKIINSEADWNATIVTNNG